MYSFFANAFAVPQDVPQKQMPRVNLMFPTLQAIDSAEQILHTQSSVALLSDTEKLEIVRRLAQTFYRSQPHKALAYATEALALATQLRNLPIRANALYSIAFAHYSLGEYPKALEQCLSAHTLAQELRYTEQIAACEVLICNAYWRQGLLTIALEHGFQALSTAQSIADTSWIAFACISIGNVYRTQYEYAQARSYLTKALEYSRRDTNSLQFASTLGILSEIELAQRHPVQALDYARRSLGTDIALRDNRSLSYAVYDIGLAFLQMQQYDSASVYLEWALRLRRQMGHRQGIAQSSVALAEVQLKLVNLEKAERLAEYALSTADSINARLDKQQALFLLAEISAQAGKYARSTEYFRQAALLKDSLANDEITRRAAWKDNQFEQERKNRQIEYLQAESGRFTVLRNALVVGVLLALALLLLAVNRYRTKKRSEAQLRRQQEILEEQAREIQLKNTELHESLETLRRAQTQLVQAEKMASLGTLVAGVAHELNTPIGVAITAASTLKSRVADFVDKVRSGAGLRKSDIERFTDDTAFGAELTLRNLERAADLVHSFKQVAVDQTRDDMRRFKVGSYVQEIITSLQPMLKGTKHRIEWECDVEDVEVESYPGALSQIITNFVQNSVKHGFTDYREDGVMRVVINPNSQLPSTQVTIIYSDNGKGISAEVLPRIFDPFFTTASGTGGTGLGLHIVYNLIRQKLGGTISVQSSTEAGTTFVCTLPMTHSPAPLP